MQYPLYFRDHLVELDSKKPVIVCGDLNVAHKEIDLANPKTNKKSAGFTKEERESMSFCCNSLIKCPYETPIISKKEISYKSCWLV